MVFEKEYPNVEATVIKLIKHLKLKITKQTIIAELERHPEYPSLLALSDILNKFNILNHAFKISDEQLVDVPLPFIAYLADKEGEFVLIENIENDKVIYNNQKLELEEFSKKFDGNILVIESVEGAGEINYKKNKRKEVIDDLRPVITLVGSFITVLLASVVISDYFNAINWVVASATLFKTLGLITSLLLLIQSIDTNNPLVQKICQSANNRNCTAILSSEAANVFDGLTWSEVGFFYFSGSWLSLVFASTSTSILQFLAIINILSLPYTFYSIYYQARVAKQWCMFCCAVQAILWLEFIPLVSTLYHPFIWLGLREYSILIICFSTPTILWIFSKPFFLAFQQIKPLKDQLQKFKYNTELFDKLLNDKPKYSTPDKDWSVVLGNPEASNVVTMVSNPYCNPCTKAHQLLSELINSANNIQVRIVFIGSQRDKNKRHEIVAHLMALDALGDSEITEQALTEWYTQKSFTQWTKKYPVTVNENIMQKLEKQLEWCFMAGVKATPTILVNGFELPAIYQINDLKYLLAY